MKSGEIWIEQCEAARRIEEVIELTGLGEHRRKLVKQLSKGTLQRVGLAQALLVPRQLVILDEPTHGLDPVWTQNFRDIVRQSRSPDRSILIASHNLDELERVADRVAIMQKAFQETMDDPEFQAEMTKASLEFTPKDGKTVAALVAELAKAPEAVIKKYKSLVGDRHGG